MSSEKYHYEAGAVHNDNHKEINIGSVSEKALGDILKHFLKDDAEDTAFEEVRDDEPVPQPKTATVEQETFANRVKAIIRKAATKNGQRIESHARGNTGAYIYYIDADAFCQAMDEMVNNYADSLTQLLGGSLNCVQVTKVCFFVGSVIRMHVINDANLQTVDVLFAFEDYYDNLQTVQAKLSDKRTTSEQNVILGTFEGLLRKHKS
ncbi:MAG: hypothetical protein E7101_03570 [Prevotella ruminicola]|uniref:Uncharacterized protein n=1 Tax=Xylanibacter ruminicola TaxID=839 RepID=A0A9D5P109_XYLRU|nr:hypothetical protein [Xylanibacter ruminicola]